MDSYRRAGAAAPAASPSSDLFARLQSQLGGSAKSPTTYAGLAAAGKPTGGAQGSAAARPGGKREQRASAFFGRTESPSPDLLAKVAVLMKQTAAQPGRRSSFTAGAEAPLPTPPGALLSERSAPEELLSGVGSSAVLGLHRSLSGAARHSQRPGSAAHVHEGGGGGGMGSQGVGSRLSSTTPEPPSSSFSIPLAGSSAARGAAGPGGGSRRHTADGGSAAADGEPGGVPAWSEELLNWMLAEKAELLLEVQRAQRRQQELQQELDRARAGGGLEEEVQRLKVERRLLLEKLQRLNQQDAEGAALLERIRMENDALTSELERSQEVCKEMLAARRTARDALSEMSAQNARLVSAYVEKKQEAAQLREELRAAQRNAEVRVRALEADLRAAQAQCAQLRGRLQQGGALPATLDLGSFPSPEAQSLPVGGLHGPGSPYAAANAAQGDEPDLGAGLDFASPFSTPARHRGPGAAQQPPAFQQQQQGGKENASWSGNRGGGGSTSVPRRKPASNEQDEGGSTPGRPASVPRPAKGEWDRERSELLNLLERLQHQLSAHAEQQQGGTPARAAPAHSEGQHMGPGPAAAQAASPPHFGSAGSEADEQQQEAAGSGAAFSGRPHAAQQAFEAAPLAGSASPPPELDPEPGPAESPPEAARTPPSHRSAFSTTPTPRHSHFSVPRQWRSEPHSRGEEYPYDGPAPGAFDGSGGSSQRSCQTAGGHSRRASGVNLSRAFDGASVGGASGGRGPAGGVSPPPASRGSSCASTASEESDCEADGGLFGRARQPRPTSAATVQLSSPSSTSEASCREEEDFEGVFGGTPFGVPKSSQPPSPVIPPTATPFGAAERPEEPPPTAPQQQGQQRQQQQHEEGQQLHSGGGGGGTTPAAARPASTGVHTTPEEQRLADVERRNAELEVEVQRLRHLQQEAAERAQHEEQRQQIDRRKQAGNAAFQQQRYEQAVEEYSAGLELCAGAGTASAAAVLLCNRAAALHAMGRYLDAVADCFRAEAADPSYARLYHRRADAYCAISAYDAAAQDLARLVQLGCGREVAARLAEVQHKQRAQYPVNHYAVLGVKSSAGAAEVKAAYRSLALRFHPDKAGSALPAPAADAIFKLVTAANAALSDAEKRRTHDLQCLRHKYRRFYSAAFF